MIRLLTIFFLFITNCTVSKVETKEVIIEQVKYADFNSAYNYLRYFEGNYGWEMYDPGGETYAGIARKYNKNWEGWLILDNYKKYNQLKKHDSIPILEFATFDYYMRVWYKEGYSELRNQEIANYIFDYRNSGPIAYIHIRKVLNIMGYSVHDYGDLDPNLVLVLNLVDEKEFLNKLKHTRMKYYIRCVKKYPQQIIFLEGWFSRTYSINS